VVAEEDGTGDCEPTAVDDGRGVRIGGEADDALKHVVFLGLIGLFLNGAKNE